MPATVAPRRRRQLQGQPGPARQVEDAVALGDVQPVLQRDVLPRCAGSPSVANSAARRPHPSSTIFHASGS